MYIYIYIYIYIYYREKQEEFIEYSKTVNTAVVGK